MNRQTLIVLGGGLCAALLVALIMQMMIGGSDDSGNDTAATRVLVAAYDLKIGDTLTEADMMWQEWPQGALFHGAITDDTIAEEDMDMPLKGRLRRNVTKGEPLLQSALVPEEKGSFVAASLAPGMRAMAIKVNAESSVGGFLVPNDRVDVVMTYDMRLPSDQNIRDASVSVISRKASQTVLENVRVVAVDQEAKEVEEVAIARTITLEVSPKQAEELALAQSMGKLSLSLRKLGEDKIISEQESAPIATTDVRMSAVMQELLGNKNSAGVQGRIVRVYNGAAPQDVVVRPYAAQ